MRPNVRGQNWNKNYAKDQNRVLLMPKSGEGYNRAISLLLNTTFDYLYRYINRMWKDNLYSMKLRCKIFAIHHLNDWLIIMVDPNTFEQVVGPNLLYIPNDLITI